jgi:hypothetical protein
MSEHPSQHMAGTVSQPPILAAADEPLPAWRRTIDAPASSSQRIEPSSADPPVEAPLRWPRVFPGL